jgi:hypothetical protein
VVHEHDGNEAQVALGVTLLHLNEHNRGKRRRMEERAS